MLLFGSVRFVQGVLGLGLWNGKVKGKERRGEERRGKERLGTRLLLVVGL